MEKTKFSLLEKIIVSVILFVSIIGITSIARAGSGTVTVTTKTDAVKNWSGTMPARTTAGSTGLFPQYYDAGGERKVTLPGSRWDFNTKNWTVNIDGSVVYCAAFGSYVRYSKFDPRQYIWLKPDGTDIQGVSYHPSGSYGTISEQLQELRLFYRTHVATASAISGKPYFRKPGEYESRSEADPYTIAYNETNIHADIAGIPHEAMNAVGYVVFDYNEHIKERILEKVEDDSQRNMAKLFSELTDDLMPTPYSKDIDDSYASPALDATYGPTIVAIEQDSDSHQWGYNVEEENKIGYSNDAAAFIFSASEDAYDEKTNGDYASKYTLNDIQTAYWLYLAAHEGGKTPTGRVTANGAKLFAAAEKYAGLNVNPSINDSKAQVIADRANKQYILGPYTLDYDGYKEDVCYVKAISINNDQNLLYDELHDGIKVVIKNGDATERPSSNGEIKKYPKPNGTFFIVLDAAKAGFPTHVSLNVNFEYVSGTRAEGIELEAEANIYQYEGYWMASGDHPMYQTNVRFYYSDPVAGESFGIEPDGPSRTEGHWEEYYDEEEEKTSTYWKIDRKWYTYSNDDNGLSRNYTVYIPYVHMNEELLASFVAQKLTVIKTVNGSMTGSAERKYTVVTKEIDVDLTMELGGYVWVDEAGGKENVSDGNSTGGERVYGMKVTLGGGPGGQTMKTLESSKDLNGNGKIDGPCEERGGYLFKGLNAMYQYSVTFEYNAQYYQPVTQAPASTWGSADWPTNSNAADKISEREAINVKFAKIGSEHGSYNGPAVGSTESYTKEELLAEGAINEFGLPKGGGSGLMSKYVQDCMLNAYTTAEYPYPPKFVIDNKQVTPEYSSCFGDNPAILYPNAYYINLGLEQRPFSDLAIKKDVDHVTVEINGHAHTYNYAQRTEDGDWDIQVRLSDHYYDTTYTRELYKSDYIYKASNYGAQPELYGKSPEDELEVYITYKILVRNQSLNIKMRIDELVDYYDEDLIYVDERSYIRGGGKVGANYNEATEESNSIYGAKGKMAGCKNLYITGLNNKYLEAGETVGLYLTFKVDKDTVNGERWLKLDYEGLNGDLSNLAEKVANEAYSKGKENTVEINGYSTIYADGVSVPNIGGVGGKPAGIVDRDSHSGDAYRSGHLLEDDTDTAPNLRVVLYKDEESRIIRGTVFDDQRTLTDTDRDTNDAAVTGNGNFESGDTPINGVTVQLVEIMSNPQPGYEEFVWREFGNVNQIEKNYGQVQTIDERYTTTGGSGTGNLDGGTKESPILNEFNLVENIDVEGYNAGGYVFKSFMPGKFIVRFIYGDTVKTVLPSDLDVSTLGLENGRNAKSYNGQDYKSTLYQQGITQPGVPYTWRQNAIWNAGSQTSEEGAFITDVPGYKSDFSNNETTTVTGTQNGYLYGIPESDANDKASDAKDIESKRVKVNTYSNNEGNGVRNYLAEVLASHKKDYRFADEAGTSTNARKDLLKELIENTSMTAETGLMVMELERNTKDTAYGEASQGQYKIEHVNFGLEERPRSQLAVNKCVTNVKLTLADGTVQFDAKEGAENLLWVPHNKYAIGNYPNNLLDENAFKNIEHIRQEHVETNIGLVQLTMDEELMHGASIEITYGITVDNVGEVDYYNTYAGIGEAPDRGFYYNGTKSADARVVQTKAMRIIDYVANNLQFNENANRNYNWKVVDKSEIFTSAPQTDLVNKFLTDKVDQYNTIIATGDIEEWLVPVLAQQKGITDENTSITVPVVLTQMITSENSTDDLTYKNLVELVVTSNTVGRRMEYSVVGNQDPTMEPQEMDSDLAEVVRILPPFGSTLNYYLILTVSLGAVVILIIGIVFIKKKVLTK